MNGQQIHRSYSSKCRAPLPPPPPSTNDNYINSGISSSFPETFISSLRQLFSILDKNNKGAVPFDVFKRYFQCSSSTSEFLNELEMQSKCNNYLITFNILLNVLERSLSSTKQTSLPIPISDSSLSSLTASTIVIPKATRPSIAFPLNRSTSVLVVAPTTRKIERPIPVVYRSSNELKTNNSNKSISVYHTKKNHSYRNNEIDFSMIRAVKRFEIERDLLIQTCDTLDRVKSYLTNRLLEMKDKQKSYRHHLSTAETIGVAPESMYNRDLVADLFKLANTVLEETNYGLKKSSDRLSSSSSFSSFNGINNQYQKELKTKENRIQQLETEKRVLLKELVEMRHQHQTVIPIKIS